MPDKNTNIDDYYAHINADKTSENSEEKSKKNIKVKIKAKKPTETVEDSAKDIPVETPETTEKPFKIKKRMPSIIIEDAPKKVEPVIIENETTEESEPEVQEAKSAPEPQTSRPVTPPAQKSENTFKRPAFTPDSRPARNEGEKTFGNNKKKGGIEEYGKRFTPNNKKSFKLRGYMEDEDDGSFRRSNKANASTRKEKNVDDMKQVLVSKTGQVIEIPEILTVKEFSEKIGIPLSQVIAELMKNGMLVTLNTKIDYDTCFLISEAFHVQVTREVTTNISLSSIMEGDISELLKNEDPEKLLPRAPIVSVMGHVDHGKTSILDYIRKTTVASGEAGGITQKIGAYQVEKNGKKITFLDTPGHEAFSIMRSRGAKLTDLAVIVIAADEGMKPQTIESINHAKSANIPMIVAVNKMDKPGANVDLIKGQLAEQGLQPEEWGGSTILVPVSAHTGLGIDDLLEMILLSTEIMELKANPDRPGIATVIESHLDAKLGSLATVLVNTGTIKKGDLIVCASSHGRVRFIRDFKGKNLDEAGPSVPVLLSGLNKVVEGGDILQVAPNAEVAAAKAHEFELMKSKKSIHNFEGASLDLLLNRIKTGNLKQLKVVLKCDSNGSLEALKNALGKLSTGEIQINFIHSGVGDVNDSDVLMAGTSQALLVAYNVGVIPHAKHTLANSKIEFIDKKVIYHIIEKVELIMTGMIDTRYEELELGEAKVKALFYTAKDKLIAWLEVVLGKVENKSKLRVIRNGKKVGNGEIINLKAGPLDVNEILEGEECGISFKGETKLEVGDVLEVYKMVQKK